MGIQIGDIVIWAWTVGVYEHPTHLRVVDLSRSRVEYDCIVQSVNSGRLYYEREENLLVVRIERKEKIDG